MIKTISGPEFLLDKFYNHHKRITSEKVQFRPDFDQLIEDFNELFGLNFVELFDEKFNISGIITTHEFNSAIKPCHPLRPAALLSRASNFFSFC